jgi:hypothetical protein
VRRCLENSSAAKMAIFRATRVISSGRMGGSSEQDDLTIPQNSGHELLDNNFRIS